MKTLQKQLSEIRELKLEELDLIGGAGENTVSATDTCGQYWDPNTQSYGTWHASDDGDSDQT